MATKQEKAVQRAVKKERKQNKIRGEKHVLGFLVALVLLLLYLLLAEHYSWWPYSRPDLGTAFYTNVSASAAKPSSASATSSSAGSSGTTGTSGSQGSSSGSSGSGSGSTGSGTTSTTSASTPSIATFSAGVNVGDTEAQTNAQANGLGQNCALVASASASTAGQQEVCTYTQGNKIVTVTYLNDHVISASKSGF
jgi:hypothetical protein